MPGLIDVGTDYKNRALSGFVRESEEQKQIDITNEELDARRRAQSAQLGAQGAIFGGIGGYMLAGTEMVKGMELGSIAGPLGIVIGAGAGFLFSRLF